MACFNGIIYGGSMQYYLFIVFLPCWLEYSNILYC